MMIVMVMIVTIMKLQMINSMVIKWNHEMDVSDNL